MRTLSPWHRHRTRAAPPRWGRRQRRPRVLVEHPDTQVREVLQQQLTEHGYDVVTCPGPGTDATRVPCPVVHDAPCPGVDGADAVICGLAPGAAAAQVVAGIGHTRPTLPVLVERRLHPTLARGEPGTHRFYRTTVAPLVRRLHHALAGVRDG